MSAKRKIRTGTLVLLIAAAVLIIYYRQRAANRTDKLTEGIIMNNTIKIASPVFEENGMIPSKYTCDGENISPPLAIDEVPEETKELVLIVDDPDAPMGIWVHWLVFNIDPRTIEIEEGLVPQNAREGKTSFGKSGYGGPCPPSGTHHYRFAIYALDEPSGAKEGADRKELEDSMEGKVIDKAVLTGIYKKN